MCKYQL